MSTRPNCPTFDALLREEPNRPFSVCEIVPTRDTEGDKACSGSSGNPRGVVIVGCAILVLAGLTASVAWLSIVPPREQLLHLTGQLQELKLRNAKTGAFTAASRWSLLK